MPYHILRRVVHIIGILTLVGAIAGKFIEHGVGLGIYGAQLSRVAWWISVWPMLVYLMCALLQGLPGGRHVVSARWARGGDVWPLIIVLTVAMPATETARLASSGGMVGSSEFELLSVVIGVLVLIARVIQLNVGARIGVTLPDEAQRP